MTAPRIPRPWSRQQEPEPVALEQRQSAQREIAAHNAAVDCRKAEKRAAKRGRITKGQQT
jgi:hypothetical protein